MKVSGTNLEMTRGDTEHIIVSNWIIDEDGQEVLQPFIEGDIVELTVRKKATDKTIMLYKKVTEFNEDGKAEIDIEPEDTAELRFGEYGYDVQVTFSQSQNVKTIIKDSVFTVAKEYTY